MFFPEKKKDKRLSGVGPAFSVSGGDNPNLGRRIKPRATILTFCEPMAPRSHFASHTDNSLTGTAAPHSRALGPRQPHETSEKFPCATRVEGSHVIAHTSEQGSYTARLRCPINRLAHHAAPRGSRPRGLVSLPNYHI